MRALALFSLLSATLYSHSYVFLHHDANESKIYSHRYGAFVDLQYRSDDIYPNGFEGSSGYELHGTKEQIELEHAGLFYHGIYKEHWVGVVELNRHNGSDDTLNSWVERAYMGYDDRFVSLHVGRVSYGVSQVKKRIYGYGFSQMPLLLDSFFSGNYYGDGFALAFNVKGLYMSVDASSDSYSHYGVYSAKFGYEGVVASSEFALFGYINYQSSVSYKFSSSANHNHSHANGCNNLGSDELCYNLERRVYGVGASIDNSYISLLGEYLQNSESGDIISANYLVDKKSDLHGFYTQAIAKSQWVDAGLRFEGYWFDTTIDGAGANAIASKIYPDGANDFDYLATAMVALKYAPYHTLRLEYSDNGSEGVARVQYLFLFDSSYL